MKLRISWIVVLSFCATVSFSQMPLACNRPADCPYGFYCHTYLGEPSVCVRCFNCGEYKRSPGTAPCARNILEDCGPCLYGYRDKATYDYFRTEMCVRSPRYPRNSGIVAQASLVTLSVAILFLYGMKRFLLTATNLLW